VSWRDSLRDASFRGVKFFVSSADADIGRRTITHEFPGRDKPAQEDLGRRARRFTLEGYVIGTDYMGARDALIRALEQRGSGKLVHPYWGEFEVSLSEAVRVRESDDEGGMARFSMPFVESGRDELPSVRTSTADGLREKCDAAKAQCLASFEKKFDATNLLQSAVNGAMNTVNSILGTINQARALVQGVFDAIDRVTEAINDVKNTVTALVALPSQLGAKFSGIYELLLSWVGGPSQETRTTSEGGDIQVALALRTLPGEAADPVDVLEATLGTLTALDVASATPAIITPTTERELANEAALRSLALELTAIESCRAVSYLDFTGYAQATHLRDELVAVLDIVALTADDLLYSQLVELRAATIAHLDAVAAALPQIVEYTPPVTVPALALAYRIYGDATLEGELVSRNGIRHPGFVPGGATLQVVSRG
jgi:prophage DNA circulation protein